MYLGVLYLYKDEIMKDDDIDIDDLLLAVATTHSKTECSDSYIWRNTITISCLHCKTRWRGVLEVSRGDYDKDHQFYYNTFYCPACPPMMDLESWGKKTLGIKNIQKFG